MNFAGGVRRSFCGAVLLISVISTVLMTVTLPRVVHASTAIANKLIRTTMGFTRVLWGNFYAVLFIRTVVAVLMSITLAG